MSYRGRRRRPHWGPKEWALWHDKRRGELTRAFYGIDADVTTAFYNLTDGQLRDVFHAYGGRHGESARLYAERTYPTWRSGAVTPSAQTLERLLSCVPPVLSFSEKAALIATLRRRSRLPVVAQVRCTRASLRPLLASNFGRVLQSVVCHAIPANVRQALDWLGSSSATAAEKILRASEYLEACRMVYDAKRDTESLEHAAARTDQVAGSVDRVFQYTIDHPYCRITVILDPTVEAATNPPPGGATMTDPILPRRPEDLLESLTRGLSEQDKADLREVAAREQLGLEVKAKGAGLAHSAAKADMERDLDAVDRLQYTQPDVHYEIRGTYQGASGHTNIDVRKKSLSEGTIKRIFWGAVILGALWLLNK